MTQDEVIKKYSQSLDYLLSRLSKLTLLDLKTPIDRKPIIYKYCLIQEEPSLEQRSKMTKTEFKFLSYNCDENVLIGDSEEEYYERLKFDRDDQQIPTDFSQDYKRLSSLTQQLIDSISEDIFQPSLNSSLNETRDAYENLADYFSNSNENHVDGTIIENGTISVRESTLINLVETPFRKGCDKTELNYVSKSSSNISKSRPRDFNNNSTCSTISPRSDVTLLNWIESLNEKRVGVSDQGYSDSGDDECSEISNKLRRSDKCVDENVLRLRNTLFSFVNTSLKNLIISPVKLGSFRLNLVQILERNEVNSVEQFVLDVFNYFSETLFYKLLESVKIEWSYRLRS